MDSIAAVLIAKIRDLGYETFSMNLWRETRLYVNVEDQPSFYFDLRDSMNIMSPRKLSSGFFGDMRSLRHFLQENRGALLKGMAPGRYYISKDSVTLGDTGLPISARTVSMVALTICGKEYLADDIREFLQDLPDQKEHPIGETLVEANVLEKDGDCYKVKDQKAVDQLLEGGFYTIRDARRG